MAAGNTDCKPTLSLYISKQLYRQVMLTRITAEVRPETKTLQIKDGQGYLLKDWNHYQVQDDVRAPNDGFHYDTTPSSAPILYQTVQNKVRAVYLGKLLPPNSTESLRPLPNMVGVWFQRDTDNGDKFDPSKQTVAKIVMTTPNMTINYDETWHVKSCPIDYTKGHYAKSLATENGKDGQDGATADSSSADNNSQPQASASN